MTNNKIKFIDDLAGITQELKKQGKKIVLCHGCFDLLHIGHVRHFEQAKKQGDLLIVTVTPDKYIDKGPNRPAFAEQLRLEAVASLSCVDFAAINLWPTAEETLRKIKPDYYAKGAEFRNISADPNGKIAGEAIVAKEIGAQLIFTDDIVFSSTNLINQYMSNFPEEIQEYLIQLRKYHDLSEFIDVTTKMQSLKVLVIGDCIIDEYHYCEAIGKSSKEPTLALKYLSSDKFAGGIVAVANHVAGFAGQTDLVTILGEIHSHEEFIRKKLNKKVSPYFTFNSGNQTLIKRRQHLKSQYRVTLRL